MGCPSEFYVGERLTRPLGLSVWIGEAKGVLRAQRSQLYDGVRTYPSTRTRLGAWRGAVESGLTRAARVNAWMPTTSCSTG